MFSWERKKTVIIPIKNQIVYNEAIELDFDVADASILSNGQKRKPGVFNRFWN